MKKPPWKNIFDLQKVGYNGARMVISTIWPDLIWIKVNGKYYRSIKVHTRIMFHKQRFLGLYIFEKIKQQY